MQDASSADDLEHARAVLAEGRFTLVLCRGASVHTSRTHGLAGLLHLLEAGTDLAGYSAADRVVGRAAGLLHVRAGVVGVYSPLMSTPAIRTLAASGIRVECDATTPAILNRAGDGPCPMEQLVADTDDPDEAFGRLRAMIPGPGSHPVAESGSGAPAAAGVTHVRHRTSADTAE